jgi:hypothetical protein
MVSAGPFSIQYPVFTLLKNKDKYIKYYFEESRFCNLSPWHYLQFLYELF